MKAQSFRAESILIFDGDRCGLRSTFQSHRSFATNVYLIIYARFGNILISASNDVQIVSFILLKLHDGIIMIRTTTTNLIFNTNK